MTTRIVTSVVLCFALLLCSHAAEANLIQNGSFETAATQTLHGATNPSELGTFDFVTGFASVSAAGVANWSNTGSRLWYLGDTDRGGAATGQAPDGDWVVLIDARGDLEGVNVLSQGGLSLVAGETYDLSFDFFGQSANAANSTLIDVDLSGAATVSVLDNQGTNGGNGSAETVTTSFTVPVTGTYTIEFSVDPTNGNNHAFIDNVSLTGPPSTPEPSTLVLVALGIAGIGFARRRVATVKK